MTRCIYWSGLRLGCALLLGIPPRDAGAQNVPPRKFSVQLSAEVRESPPRITLAWPDEGDAGGYRISRRTSTSGWSELATLAGDQTTFADSNLSLGTKYEYQVIKRAGLYAGYGYISAGIEIPVTEDRGKIILLVENSIAEALHPEISRLQNDLIGDGWLVIHRNVASGDSPQAVKELIRSIYHRDPLNVKALFLLGHIPVPYSGNFFPDGHENHQGAWPADSFYADVDGEWTDSVIQNTRAERQSNWNVPGDGKLDQSNIPSPVELMIGRVDLSNLTCYANKPNARSEIDLTRQYLNKNHAFRLGELLVEQRGLICDNFSDKGTDPISGSAWRNFSTLFGQAKITEVGWDGYLPAATQGSYLWSYASGGGSYYYSSGVGTSDDFAFQDVRVVFTMFMGSYFGDWNNESNFLRAALGSGSVLTTSYSGFPQTLYFPMALGEPIGYANLLTQNNATNGLYPPWNKGAGQVHVALLGDPTLRMAAVRPPVNLKASSGESIRLTWDSSPDPVVGYHVYRTTRIETPFARVTADPVTATSFTDYPPAGNQIYMVRAVKLERTGSGTYFNPSQGMFATAVGSGDVGPISDRPLQLELRVAGAGATLRVRGDSGQKFRVYSSGDLQNWIEITTAALETNSIEIPVALSQKQTYFRTLNFQ